MQAYNDSDESYQELPDDFIEQDFVTMLSETPSQSDEMAENDFYLNDPETYIHCNHATAKHSLNYSANLIPIHGLQTCSEQEACTVCYTSESANYSMNSNSQHQYSEHNIVAENLDYYTNDQKMELDVHPHYKYQHWQFDNVENDHITNVEPSYVKDQPNCGESIFTMRCESRPTQKAMCDGEKTTSLAGSPHIQHYHNRHNCTPADFNLYDNYKIVEFNMHPEYQYLAFENEQNELMVKQESTFVKMEPMYFTEGNHSFRRDNVSSQQNSMGTPIGSSKYTQEQAEAMLDAPTIINLPSFDVGKLCEDMKKFLADNAHCGGAKRYTQMNMAAHIFGKAQGTFSRLINSVPKWEVLKGGKKVYQRMFNWLNMSDEDRREIWKLDLAPKKYQKTENSSDNAILSLHQRKYLENYLLHNSRPMQYETLRIADKLELSTDTIENWFTDARKWC